MRKFSIDPLIKTVSIDEFLEKYNYLMEYEGHIWENKKPEPNLVYYKITSKYFISILYKEISTNFGLDREEKLERIEVAYRNGKKEYDLYNNKIQKLNIQQKHILKYVFDALVPPYEEEKEKAYIKSNLEDYIIDTGYITENSYQNKYVVFDVETNGIRKKYDDLLSIAIYDPYSGLCYNRYLPLDLQPMVLRTYRNGIYDEMLENKSHLTQDEFNEIIDKFDLNNRIILTYSGGKGDFDRIIFENYCKRQGIKNFENFKFENIKKYIPSATFEVNGQLSKDNLCKLFNISGIKDIHTGDNDCLLEWKLFEHVYNKKMLFIKNTLYEFTPDYIIPISYLIRYPILGEFAGHKIPEIEESHSVVFSYNFPKKIVNQIKKFPTNITGVTVEDAIYEKLKITKENNNNFLVSNKMKLKIIGELESKIENVPVIKEKGLLKSLNPIYEMFVQDINRVTNLISVELDKTVEFIKNYIFNNEKIKNQELVFSDDKKVLALCDLSSQNSIIEIKTNNVIANDKIGQDILTQLYYQSNRRQTYLLSIEFNREKAVLDNVKVKIYKIDLKVKN